MQASRLRGRAHKNLCHMHLATRQLDSMIYSCGYIPVSKMNTIELCYAADVQTNLYRYRHTWCRGLLQDFANRNEEKNMLN